MHLHHDSLAFMPPASHFATFWLGHAQKSKFWDLVFGRESDLDVFRLFDFWNFFLVFPFLSFLLQWLAFHWACLRLKNFWESIMETGNLYHGAARCSGSKFWSEFFAPCFEHFCAYLRLHLANHSDLGITGKMFFSCRRWALCRCQFWSKVMTSEVEERSAKARHGRLQPAWKSILG